MVAARPLALAALVTTVGCGGEPKAEAPEAGAPEVAAEAVAPAPAPPEPAAACAPELTLVLPTREARSPVAVPLSPELKHVREVLAKVVHDHGRDPDNPWAVGHAILALGPEIELTNGKPAVDHLFEAWAVVEGAGIGFPTKRGAVRIEPHTDLTLKALTEAGLAPDRAVTVEGKPFQLGDLYRQSLCGAWVSGKQLSFDSWNDSPWALQGLAAWAPDDLSWTAEGGHAMTMDALTGAVVDQLHEETAFMRSAMKSGATVQKRRQGIFAYTCGGAHLLQGAAYAVARGFGSETHRQHVEAEVPVLFWRVDLELAAVDEAVKQHPEYGVILVEQRLKFLGHFLETAHKMAALGLYEPDEAQRAELDRAVAELVATVDTLEKSGVFGKLDEVRATNEQLYLDFVGDSAHTVRAIDLATGAGVLRY